MSEPLVYLNGQMLPASQAVLRIYDAGLVLGATVTEMARTFHHRPWRLREHLDRLHGSLRATRLEINLSEQQLAALSEELVAHNARLIDNDDELGLILFITAGEHALYASRPPRTEPTVCVHTFVLPFERWATKMRTGAHVVTPSVRHIPPQCIDPRIKHRSRMHFYLADQEARLVDPEAVALLLDLQGNVTETSTANFMIVEKGVIVSPPTINTLSGVSRAMVIELAGKLNIPFVERDVQISNVMSADEALLTSTPYCVMPATKINGTPIGAGQPGPMWRRLLNAWSESVGLDIDEQMQEATRRRGAAK